jgi:hypothetical protein
MEMPAAPGCPGTPAEVSAETALQAEVTALAEWLVAQGLDPRRDRAQHDEGSRERLSWRYGYYAGLKRALALLSGRRATLH